MMKKYFFSFLLFIFLASTFSNTYFVSRAVENVGVCSPEGITFEKASKIWELDIRRTVDNLITSAVINLFASSVGTNPDRVMACQNYLRAEVMKIFPEDKLDLKSITGTCPEPELGVCEALAADMGGGVASLGGDDIAVRGINSSLLGFGNLVENFVVREPLPVNLAYSWNQTISKVPFANKALAADDPAENLPIVKASFEAWKFSRNIALGLISMVLLYTGIMIVMRKKVNQQLVVSVQYAIPKILIGIILIIFSYALGALITSISWGLFRGSFTLLFREVFNNTAVAEFPSGIVLLAVIVLILQLAQGGPFYITLVLIMGLILVILKLVVYFKALLIYIKMVFSILTAPFEFVLGAIPGSEARITDWFKRMAKYGITIFAMGLMIPLTLYLALAVLVAYSSGSGAEMGGWGVVMALLAPMIIVVFGFSLALGMEKKIDLMFFGAQKKK